MSALFNEKTLEDTPNALLIHFLTENETNKTGAWRNRNNPRIKENFEKWFKSIYSHNLELLSNSTEITQLEVFRKFTDSEEGFLSYENFDEDTEKLQSKSENLEYPTKDVEDLSKKEMIAVRFAKAFLNTGNENYIKYHDKNNYQRIKLEGNDKGSKGYRKTKLTGFTRYLNKNFDTEFEEQTNSFREVKSGSLGYVPVNYACTELGDALTRSGYGFYSFFNSKEDNHSLYLYLRKEAIENLDIEPLDIDFSKIEDENTKALSSLNAKEFEDLIALVFANKGYRTELTPQSGDYGADVLAENDQEKIAIQVKLSRSGSSGNSAIQEASSAKINYDCNKAIAVTSSQFSSQAKDEAKRQNVELMTGKDVKEAMEEHNIELEDFKN